MKRLSLLLAALLLTSACSPAFVPPPKTAQSYLSEGESFFDKGLYEEAIASWEKARESYHSPDLTLLAELKIAEAHYRAEQYVEAATAYEDFLKQHPGHEKTPDVLYLLGMSYFNQILDIDRDQTATRNALVTFENLTERFPDHPRAQEVKPLIRRAVDNLAAHELYVGSFYLRTGKHEAAIRRLKGLFRDFPDYPGRDEAYFLLGQAYLKAGLQKEAIEAFNILHRDFPKSEHVTQAQKFLEKNL